MSQLEERKMKPLSGFNKLGLAAILFVIFSLTVSAANDDSWLEARKDSSWDRWVSEFETVKEDWTQLAITPGVDESQLNFAWYSPEGAQDLPKIKVSLNANMSEAREFTGEFSNAVPGYVSNKVTVMNLQPNQTYYYRYGNDEHWSDVYRYQSQGSNNFSFIAVSDPQIGASSENIATGETEKQGQLKAVRNDSYNWNETLRKAMQIRKEASFILCVGDQVQSRDFSEQLHYTDNEIEYSGFLAPTLLRNIPIATTIGNHDAMSGNYSFHFHNPNATELGSTIAGGDYYYSYGDALFIVLNSNSTDTMAHEMLIKQAVEDHPDSRWRFVSVHHDLYGSGQHSNDPKMIRLRDTLVPLFETYQIDVVLMGHDHTYSRSKFLKGSNLQERMMLTDEEYRAYIKGKVSSDIQFEQYLASIEDEDVIVESDQVVDGVITNPEGILYLTLNSASGSKFYEPVTIKQPFIEARWQEYVPTFTVIDVSSQQIVIQTYRTDNLQLVDDKLTIIKQ